MGNEIRDIEIDKLKQLASHPALEGDWVTVEEARQNAVPAGYDEYIAYVSPERVLALIDRLENAENDNDELRSQLDGIEVIEEGPTSWPDATLAILCGPFGWLIGFALLYFVLNLADVVKSFNVQPCKIVATQTK